MTGCHRDTSSWRRAIVAGAVALSGAGLLAACGSSSSSSTTTTAGSGSSASTGAGGGDVSSKLNALTGNVKSAQKSTFQAVYTSTSGGTTSTITLAQSPPKQLFSSTDPSGSTTSLINTGTTTYSCSGGSGSTTCTSIGGGAAAGALTSLISVYNGSAALSVLNSWQAVIASHVTGVSLTFTDETIAGQPSTCAHWSHQGDQATYCVTSTGVLAKVESSGGQSFALTSYTHAPPASIFAVPQGATVVTLPGGVTAP